MRSQGNDEILTLPRLDCFLCGASGRDLYQGLNDKIFGAPGQWGFLKCADPDCGLVWLYPTPSMADLGKAYKSYYTHQVQEMRKGTTPWRGLRWAHDTLWRLTRVHHQRARLSFMYLHDTTPGRLLDIGCGDGSRLARMRTLGWRVEGQEVDPQVAAVAGIDHEIPVHLGALNDINFPSSTFDAITMNHVIEHVFDPLDVLKECHRILRPGGVLVAVTPNVESYGHTLFGRWWRGLEPPRHLHLFSQATMHRLALRAGFSLCDVWTTAAHAEVIASGSFEVRAAGARKEEARVTQVNRRLMSIAFQLWAQLVYLTDRNSGEECVMKVTK